MTAPTLAAADPESLYRAADRVAAWLRLRPPEERLELLRKALHDPDMSDLPPQAVALASFNWPLVITTNYDDIVPRAYRRRRPGDAAGDFAILGRSRDDCARVVRSLDVLASPIVWYVQGHVGEGAVRRSLLDEVVVGHQQYQQAINASTSFRRAFSEVFRRRSLLFVGSGLAESYFVNLIAETLFSLGPSSQTHFALFCDADLQGRVDPEFLAVRLGITPVRYGASHADLPAALEAIGRDTAAPAPRARAFGLTRMTFTIPRGANGGASPVAVELRHGPVEAPPDGGCVVLSVGRDRVGGRFEPGLGSQARSFLRHFVGPGRRAETRFVDVAALPQGRMFRVLVRGEPIPVFLLAARELDHARHDDEARSLAVVAEATKEALRAVEQAGFSQVAMGLMAAGPSRTDEPPYCLAAQLSGIRAFAATPVPSRGGISAVGIDIVDDEVWSPLVQGRIPVLDLLTSRLARVLVRVADEGGAVEEFALSVPHGSTIGDVLATYRIADEGIEISARPLPRRRLGEMQGERVFPGMVIDVCPPSLDR
ncbi:SIR2 family NAD-dependent protein deacylase [Falsiroseomonas sp. CW058]|uniref:SIR2 family NAD-dependent protein deacylase n=1 Tax=Falsiroseomonas sp. CW058 TaxID=3388664 RepID=UPI003D31A6C4